MCVGQTVTEQVGADLTVERDVVDRLRAGIAMCREKGDITPANLHESFSPTRNTTSTIWRPSLN
ncbi:bacterioferritin [Kutzneria sp. 744]|nr:bacterioferritin [Kutzneria sp. 744]